MRRKSSVPKIEQISLPQYLDLEKDFFSQERIWCKRQFSFYKNVKLQSGPHSDKAKSFLTSLAEAALLFCRCEVAAEKGHIWHMHMLHVSDFLIFKWLIQKSVSVTGIVSNC